MSITKLGRSVLAVLCTVPMWLAVPVQAFSLPTPSGTNYSAIQAQPCSGTGTGTTTSGTVQTSVSQTENVQCTVNDLTDRILSDVIFVMGIAALLMLTYAGIQYIQANGNADAIKKARQNIFNVVLGIIILVVAYTVIDLISNGVQYFGSS